MFNGDYFGEVSGDSGTGVGIEKLLAQTEIGKWSLVLKLVWKYYAALQVASYFFLQTSPWI